MVNVATLAAASWLPTPDGWRRAADLQTASAVWAVARSGQLCEARIGASRPLGQSELIRIFTRTSDILVPRQASMAGAKGPVGAAELAPGRGQLEGITPGDLPASSTAPVPLAGLAGTVFTIPESVSDSARLVAALGAAGIAHQLQQAGGFKAVRVWATGKTPDWTWEQELALLEMLTAWPDAENVVQRTRVGERQLRTRMFEALMETRCAYEVRWVPGYLPVEARLWHTAGPTPAFTDITALHEIAGEAVELEIEQAAAVVCDGVYVKLRHRR